MTEIFGTTENNETVSIYKLRNENTRLSFLNLGCIIQKWETKDGNGNFDDIVTGFENVADYEQKSQYFGCVVGRFANRIGGGKFCLNGKEYNLFINNGPNSLHGGQIGWSKKIWNVENFSENAITFTLISPHLDEGYPCEVKASVTYTLLENSLEIQYTAKNLSETDSTPINMTNHTYFNLGGHQNWTTLDKHTASLTSDKFLQVDANLIPTGEIISEPGMDLTVGKKLTPEVLSATNGNNGFDHCFVFKNENSSEIKQVAEITHENGRKLVVSTDAPGAQFYTGNFLRGQTGKEHVAYIRQSGFCVETQAFPDAPNKPSFPSCIIGPNAEYRHRTIFKF